MPLDPQLEDLLKARAESGAPPVESVPPEVARANYNAQYREPGPEVGRVEDRSIPTPAGEVPVRIYLPSGDGPFPALVWMHGGGWVLGNLDSNDGLCRRLVDMARVGVVSVDYSLAPEAKFPQAVNECHGVAAWLAEHGQSVGIDGARIAVGGASSGGNLAAAVALKVRDDGGPRPSGPVRRTGLKGPTPRIAMQLLVYPVLDFGTGTESYRLYGEGYGLNGNSMAYYGQCYLNDEAETRHPYAAPLQAEDLSGLPQAHVITAECDPLRDDGEAYARRLQEAGVSATCTRYEGMVHAFFGFSPRIRKTQEALEEAAAVLRKGLVG